MAATFNWNQTYGTSPGTAVDLGSTGNLFNFKNYDDADPTNYTTYPVTAGFNPYEVWLRAHFTGTFNVIQNLQFYKSSGALGTGITMFWTGEREAYATPVATNSTIATTTIPTSSPGTANVSIGGNLAGTLEAAGYSDYIVLQTRTTSSASVGDSETWIYTLSYDEN
jgi:hypothetical protein